MSRSALAWTAAIAIVLAGLCTFAIDRSIALAMHNSGIESAAIMVRAREFLDTLTGYRFNGIGDLLLGGCLAALGSFWVVAQRTNATARALIFTGLVQLATIAAASQIKGVFGRLRPYQLIERGDWSHIWFAGGNSFPSGHVAFYWGLFTPLAYLYPRYRLPLLAIPVFIAFARIDENVHFLSDVLGSIALAALMTLLAAVLLGRWIQPGAAHER
ncbi:MAG TPA: phosphatase PAP2 family protein [Rudaea sp.]|jgi:membrane-associated phospholipid phosphatase